jgi:subtilisin family serine protease
MNYLVATTFRRVFGATSLTRNNVAAAVLAGMTLAASGAAFGLKPQLLPEAGTTVDVAPRKATSADAQKADTHVLIQLTQPAAVESYAAVVKAAGLPQTGSTPSAIAAGRNQIAANQAQQAALINSLQAAGIPFKEIYRVQRAMNGVAVVVPSAKLDAIRKLPGVKSVRPIEPSVPTSNGSTAFLGAPQVWQGSPAAADGTGMRVGIIDSGIDYQHANFGGTGLLADYQANNRVTISPSLFPTPKVAGGTDLAGDAYDANSTTGAQIPVPDPNPTDCGGHGSHVAGTAAGFGVTAGGATYPGPYNTSLPSTLRIQPGIAPKAQLYAIRVFGCGGSTDLVVQGIDWALDPNQNGDLSDHLDVINMSLGSNNGNLSNLDTDASDAAALSGMIVVASAGNAGDTYFITGSPGTSQRTISVAASLDSGETLFNFSMTAPPALAGSNYNAIPAAFGPAVPPMAGDVAYATPPNGCTAITGVTGKVALIDRGTCSFQIKVSAAEAAGATGVIVVQNSTAAPIVMGGTGAGIPSIMISQADGALIKAQLAILPTPPTVTGSVTVGASLADTIASFSSRGPVNDLPGALKPDLTAPGYNIVSTQTGMTCITGGCLTPTATGYDPGNQLLVLSGTSMAAPQVAGMMALLRQLNPTLSVEEMKALAMNGSLHDVTTQPAGAGLKYGAGRVGAGRIDPVTSANLKVTAYNADNSGAVSVSFPSEIGASTVVTKKVRVRNLTSTPTTFTLGINTIVNNPGVAFSLPGGTSLSLLGHQTVDIDVRMTGVANQVTNNYDPTITLTQVTNLGTLPRYWLPEETAYLTISTGATLQSRVPLYVSPYPAASMSGGTTVPTGGGAAGTTAIPLTGTGICTGVLTPGAPPSCAGAFPVDEVSLVSPFELQASNPRNLAVDPKYNLRHAGVSADGTTLSFGIGLWGPAALLTTEIDTAVEVTLVTPAGAPLYTLFPYYATVPGASTATNVYLTGVYNWAANTTSLYYFANAVDSTCCDTRIFNNDVFFMSAPLTALGLTPGSTIHYYVDTYGPSGNVDDVGPLTMNLGAQGLNFGGGLLLDDLPGATIPVTYNVANLTANGSLGALLLHHHNAAGSRAQVLAVPPVTLVPAVLQSAVSRKVHAAAGTFDLPLTLAPPVNHNPTTEPRQGPTATVVLTFDKAIASAVAAVTEGTATAAAPTFSGNDVVVNLTGVTDQQYVTVSLTNVAGVDGSTGGSGSVRIGFLLGDVNASRSITVADVGLVNAQLSQPVTAANYLKDLNVSGTLTLGDKGLANGALTHALPAPRRSSNSYISGRAEPGAAAAFMPVQARRSLRGRDRRVSRRCACGSRARRSAPGSAGRTSATSSRCSRDRSGCARPGRCCHADR